MVNILELVEIFQDAAAMYPENTDGGGQLIGELLQGEWQIFSTRIVDRDLVQKMTVAILTVNLREKAAFEANYAGLFDASKWSHSTLEESWHERVEDFFGRTAKVPTHVSDEKRQMYVQAEEEARRGLDDRLAFALSDVGSTYSYAEGQILYRARIHTCRQRHTRFSASEMSAPPPEKATDGRANREGQPVLYMAGDLETAVAEVRSWKGAVIAVAKLEITRELQILDLREPEYLDSPFFKENLRWRVETNELLRRFGAELSRPVLPNEAATHYLPSQHLCDLEIAASSVVRPFSAAPCNLGSEQRARSGPGCRT